MLTPAPLAKQHLASAHGYLRTLHSFFGYKLALNAFWCWRFQTRPLPPRGSLVILFQFFLLFSSSLASSFLSYSIHGDNWVALHLPFHLDRSSLFYVFLFVERSKESRISSKLKLDFSFTSLHFNSLKVSTKELTSPFQTLI